MDQQGDTRLGCRNPAITITAPLQWRAMTSDNAGNGADASQLGELRVLMATGRPARIRKAIGELVLIQDDGTALALAARSEHAAEFPRRPCYGCGPRPPTRTVSARPCSPPPSRARTGPRCACGG